MLQVRHGASPVALEIQTGQPLQISANLVAFVIMTVIQPPTALISTIMDINRSFDSASLPSLTNTLVLFQSEGNTFKLNTENTAVDHD